MTNQDVVELEDFVREAILQVARAVHGAAGEVKKMGGAINPRPYGENKDIAGVNVIRTRGNHMISFLEFDVAVTAIRKQGVKSGIGVVFAAINAGLSGDREKEDNTVSRVSFRVPIVLPHTGQK